MKKILASFYMIILVLSVGMANTPKISGRWLMVKAESGDKIDNPYILIIFTEKGEIKIMGTKIGSWNYDKKNNNIIVKSPRFKNFNGKNKILKLTDKNMIVVNGNYKFYYLKIDKDDFSKINKVSKLEGIWKITANNNSVKYLKFKLPDSFLFLNMEEGMKETAKGQWLYFPKDNSVVIISFSPLFKGKIKILNLSSQKLDFEKKGKKITATREIPTKINIERLNFKYEDFPEENNDDNKLPWRDFEKMTDFLKNVKTIEYNRAVLINELNIFRYTKILSEISVEENNPSVRFTNFIISKKGKKQFSENYKGGLTERYNYFFPKEEPMPYRITGTETIEVPAGKFSCTVVEGFDGDYRIKLWMINDMPGVYARIIKEGTLAGGEPDYTITELSKIEKF